MKNIKANVGNWVVGSKVSGKPKKFRTVSKLKEVQGLDFVYPYILEDGSYCETIELWVPTEDCWCWFCEDPDNFPIDFVLDRFLRKDKLGNYQTKHNSESYKSCFPFIGELPF